MAPAESFPAIATQQQQLQMKPEPFAKQRPASTIRRNRQRCPTNVDMNVITLVFTLIIVSWQQCSAFPMPALQTASWHHVVRSGSRFDRSASVPDSLTSKQVQLTDDIRLRSKPNGFFTWLFRRRKQQQILPHNEAGSSSGATNSRNKLWQRAIRSLRSKLSSKRFATNHNQIRYAAVAHKTNPSPSTRQTIHPRYRHNKSKTHPFKLHPSTTPITSPTALQMVLSTPESIIEQVSTEKLLDALIDESVRTSSREPIMMQFNPSRGWIWRQWRGTVFSETWKSGLLNMALATCVVFLYKVYPGLREGLQGFSILWGQLLSVTTFTLTFFLNQSYGLWRKCYDYSRRLQGRLNDLGMTLAAHATRIVPSSPDIPSTYTPQSRQALELVSRYVRVFNLLTYASFTRSHRPILTPRGMRRLVERGILTGREREILIDAEIPATQRHNAVLVWLIRLFLEGRQTGVFEGGYGFEEQFMEKCHVIRAQYGAIGDELQGRMPLAYAHIVQVLLDVVLWMYPFMALSTGMAWYIGVVGTGLLTMFYQGLFDLAKQFLDPYDNENYGKGEDPLVIDTLIAETNAGSVRWFNSFQQQPWNKQLLKDGELYDSVLPLRGYSVEELMEKKAQEEAEQMEKDRALQEKKLKEEKIERERAEDWLQENFASYVQNGTVSFVEKSNGTAILSPRAEKAMSNSVSNKTLLEVSGGQVISTSTLIPSRAFINRTKVAEDTLDNSNKTEAKEKDTPVHKVLTLDDGTPVATQDESLAIDDTELDTSLQKDQEQIEIKVDDATQATTADTPQDATSLLPWGKIGDKTPTFKDTINGAGSYLSTLSRDSNQFLESRSYDEDGDDDSDSDPFDIVWFEEVGPDGKEMRLSQMLADEDWSHLNEDESSNKTMDYEEFARKANDLIERTENEIAETKEILYSSPGSQAEYDAKERSTTTLNKQVAAEEEQPLYDQTLLDPISQLAGLPPHVLGKKMLSDDEEEPKTINDGLDFANIYALWGKPLASKASTEEDTDVISPPLDGILQLWPDKGDKTPVDPKSLAPVEPDFTSDSEYVRSTLNGLEWWDKISEDGKEIRLSMMLADEEYEEELESKEDEPMTLEKFAMETENMIQLVEEERKETEAIMNAPPNANFLDDSDEVKESSPSSLENTLNAVASSEKFEEMVMSLSQLDIENNGEESLKSDTDDFSVLEMDVEDDDSTENNSLIPGKKNEQAGYIKEEATSNITGTNRE